MEKLTSNWLRFYASFYTFLTLLSLPLFLILVPLFFSYRAIIQRLSRLCRPDLCKMLTKLSNMWAVDYPEMFTSHSLSTLYVSMVIDNSNPQIPPLTISTIRQQLLSNMINKKIPETGRLANPELKQTITKWMGFLFWRWDDSFSIENHVNFYSPLSDPQFVYDDEIPMLMKDLAICPFVKGRSPWEIWLLPNGRLRRDPSKRRKLIAILRIHHSMADGYSIIKLLMEDVLGESGMTVDVGVVRSHEEGNSKNVEQWKWDLRIFSFVWKIPQFCILLFKLPYDLFYMVLQCQDDNEWHLPVEKLSKKFNSTLTRRVGVDKIKLIKNINSCSFYTVVAAAISGGLRNFILEEGREIPKSLHVVLPLPAKRPTWNLRNYWTCVIAPLPVNSSRKRLEIVDENFNSLRSSTVPFSLFHIFNFIGALPAKWTKKVGKILMVSGLCSDFPGPLKGLKFIGRDLDDVVFGAAPLQGNIGFQTYSLSYDGGLRILVSVDEAIVKEAKLVQRLGEKIVQEFDVLLGKMGRTS